VDLRAPTRIRFLAPLTLVLFSASTAHAQRIPNEFIWFAGTSLFAPFVAIPIKLGILRLLKQKAACSRLWSISAIEFLLWFPIGYFALRFGRSTSAPVIVLALFASVVWAHTAFLANTSWRSAFFLSLPTPVVALLLPFLAFWLAAHLY
jgi:hypothetical protein